MNMGLVNSHICALDAAAGRQLHLVEVLRERSWPFGSKLPRSAKFGTNVDYTILFQFLTGAETSPPLNGRKLRYSIWPPRATPTNASQELKGLQVCSIPHFQCFWGQRLWLLTYFVDLRSFSSFKFEITVNVHVCSRSYITKILWKCIGTWSYKLWCIVKCQNKN